MKKHIIFTFAACAFFSCSEEKQEQVVEQQPANKDSVAVPVKPAFDLSKLKGTWKLEYQKGGSSEIYYDDDLFINDSTWQMCDKSRKPVMNNEIGAYMESCLFYRCQYMDSLKGTVSLKWMPGYYNQSRANDTAGRLQVFDIKALTDSNLVLQGRDVKEEGIYVRVPKNGLKH